MEATENVKAYEYIVNQETQKFYASQYYQKNKRKQNSAFKARL